MPCGIGDKKLKIRCCWTFQLIEIPENFAFRITERFGINRAGFDRMFVHHFLGFFDVQGKIVLYRKISDENFGFHFWVINVIPTSIFGIFNFGKIRIFDSNINFFIFLLHLKYQKVKVFQFKLESKHPCPLAFYFLENSRQMCTAHCR